MWFPSRTRFLPSFTLQTGISSPVQGSAISHITVPGMIDHTLFDRWFELVWDPLVTPEHWVLYRPDVTRNQWVYSPEILDCLHAGIKRWVELNVAQPLGLMLASSYDIEMVARDIVKECLSDGAIREYHVIGGTAPPMGGLQRHLNFTKLAADQYGRAVGEKIYNQQKNAAATFVTGTPVGAANTEVVGRGSNTSSDDDSAGEWTRIPDVSSDLQALGSAAAEVRRALAAGYTLPEPPEPVFHVCYICGTTATTRVCKKCQHQHFGGSND